MYCTYREILIRSSIPSRSVNIVHTPSLILKDKTNQKIQQLRKKINKKKLLKVEMIKGIEDE